MLKLQTPLLLYLIHTTSLLFILSELTQPPFACDSSYPATKSYPFCEPTLPSPHHRTSLRFGVSSHIRRKYIPTHQLSSRHSKTRYPGIPMVVGSLTRFSRQQKHSFQRNNSNGHQFPSSEFTGFSRYISATILELYRTRESQWVMCAYNRVNGSPTAPITISCRKQPKAGGVSEGISLQTVLLSPLFLSNKGMLKNQKMLVQMFLMLRNGKVYLLTDNEDVERFIAYISVSQDDVTLYVVEPRSSIVGSVAGSNQLSFSQNPQPFSNPNPNKLSAPNSGFRIDQLDDDEPTEKIVSTSQYSKFGLGQYPDFDIGQYTDFDDVSEEETDHVCNDFHIGQYPNFDDETPVAEEDVVDDNEEEVTTVNEHVEHPFCNSYNPEEEKKKKKSPKKRKCHGSITGICQNYFSYRKKSWQRKQLIVTQKVYRGHEIMTDMNARFKISISYSQAWRAKCYALELLRGSPEASFAQLPAYCHNLKLKNPGSVTHIKTDRDGRFELLFIAIGATIRSFITCMRPVIIVDGAHLKGRYLGVNLLAVAMDANNGILPIAYGVGKSETSDSWTWFMGHLRDCIGPISNLTIISDRANSIDNAVRRCFPDAFHGLCGVHLYRNLKSRSAGIKKHKWTYWKAVKAYREVDFNKHINCLRRVLPQCAQTLEDVGFERWSRVHQLGARYGFMTSNSAESINALSRHSRKLPITMLMEFFRASIQQWYYKKRNHAGTLEHRVTPWTEKKITKRVVKSTSWRVEPCSNTLFQVLDNNLNGLVDLNAKTCSCMKWQTSGYPCGHVIKVALHLNQDDSSAYAMDCYTTEVYRQTYAEIVYPIPHPSEWDIPDDLQTVLPPAMDRRLPGRPKSHDRIPSKGEEKKRSTCSRCKESGHTRLTCGSPVPSKSSFPLPKYGSSSKSKAHMVSSKRQPSLKSQSQLASPFGTVNLVVITIRHAFDYRNTEITIATRESQCEMKIALRFSRCDFHFRIAIFISHCDSLIAIFISHCDFHFALR
ncbi:hypothetical protein F3Y22_tig00116965pilonHSYRG00537 [Hibiscus syriacus]|uniref:SWIM-type domain-containing protein n=1 Tax=Hibiscus syriacus TaxID=106335 RepID=A0A6A2XA02_HIBSY|nr:hypothetical protein F3Y22_tig00116965pilonHSYRG00537 [Hibiscus syriacus]